MFFWTKKKSPKVNEEIVLIDNYDSFVYNLVHYIEGYLKCKIKVFKNDQIDWKALDNSKLILLSPGPGLPNESGFLMEIIQKYYLTHSLFGVCLGMQALGLHFDMSLQNLDIPLHGLSTKLIATDREDKLFKGFSTKKDITIGHYHSWALSSQNTPSDISVSSVNKEGLAMSFYHKKLPISGVQFHPESILTPHGKKMLKNKIDEYLS